MTPLAALLKKHQVKTLGYEDRRMSVSAYHQYEQALPCRLTPLGGRLEEVRQVKEEGEVECIVIAQRMAEAAFEELLPMIRPGVTEKQLKRYSAWARRRRRLRRLTLLMLVLAAAFLLIDRNFRPLVFSLAEARSAAMATRALNGALTEALEDGVEYDDLMNVRMDDSGQVSLLSANTMRMNALADRAGDAALRKLETVSAQKVYVPLGAALGLTLFAGSGPRIPISIVPVGTVQTDFETEFEACGINQTRHKVYLQLSASIRIVIPTGAKTTNVSANMLVAESIIIGKVPESFVGYNLNPDELNMVP